MTKPVEEEQEMILALSQLMIGKDYPNIGQIIDALKPIIQANYLPKARVREAIGEDEVRSATLYDKGHEHFATQRKIPARNELRTQIREDLQL